MHKPNSSKTAHGLEIAKREILSSKDFVAASQTAASRIKNASFIPPKIGSKGFGSFDVEYRVSKLVTCRD